MVHRETLPQQDGSLWQYYHIADGAAILTSKGRELVHSNPAVLGQIHQYRQKCLGRIATTELPSVRSWFRNGGNSDIYELSKGSGLVVKESTTTQAMYFALQRMDKLKSVIESKVPRWIDVPEHYGLICSSTSPADYMLMEKIDGGVTVADVVNPSTEELRENPLLLSAFGARTEEVRGEVSDRFDMAKELLDNALTSSGLLPVDFLPDWDDSNVLVEKLKTPVAGSNYMFWVIDQ